MKRFKVSTPGKLHLLGEHSVVYNKPAILAAVDKRCYIEILKREDNHIRITSKNYNKDIYFSYEEIVKYFEKAQKNWDLYDEKNDISLLKSITKNPLDYPIVIIGQFIKYYKLTSIDGFELIIDSEIPVGAGMGSSGALAVSVIGSLTLFFNKSFDLDTINKIAFLAEQKKHGRPSGGDNSTSIYGGLVRFKKDEGLKPLNMNLAEEVSDNFYIVNTGTPTESTGEMVGLVRRLVENDPEFTNAILQDQEKLVNNLLPAIQNAKHEEIDKIIKKGEANLEKLGVVSEYAKEIIRDIEKSGGAAKICGAGGIKRSTGIILIYHKNKLVLNKYLKKYNLELDKIKLGTQGLRIDYE